MNESPEQKYSRLQGEIQRAILQDYPNPDRKGCPGEATVRNFAKHPETITVEAAMDEHSAWYHITHCSPCYATFLELREADPAHERGRHGITRRAMFLTPVAAA